MSRSKTICISYRPDEQAALIKELSEKGFEVREDCIPRRSDTCDRDIQALIQQDKLASLGTLVAGVAHELNNPNHFIRLNSELLSKAWPTLVLILDEYHKDHGGFQLAGLDYPEAKQRLSDALTGIHEGSDRIRNLVNELKSYARQQPAELTEPIDVQSVFRSATLLLSNAINKAALTFSIDIAEGIPMFPGHFQHIEQVLINLLQNACRAVEHCAEGCIFLRARYDAAPGEVVFEVEDNGAGIAEKDMKHITDPFFTTHREEGGTGLGLSVSLSIVHEHGGTLEFESEQGQGTTARVRLPARGENA